MNVGNLIGTKFYFHTLVIENYWFHFLTRTQKKTNDEFLW